MVREIKADVLPHNPGRIKRFSPVVSLIIVEQKVLKERIFHKRIKHNNCNRYFPHMYGILVTIASA